MSDTEPEYKEPTVEMPQEDDVVEFVFNEDGEEDLKATLKKFRKDLKESKSKEMEYLTNWQRERADFQNYKKEDSNRVAQIGGYVR
jgi:molecular chaperone GrpE (heat shock protein)